MSMREVHQEMRPIGPRLIRLILLDLYEDDEHCPLGESFKGGQIRAMTSNTSVCDAKADRPIRRESGYGP